MGRGGGGGGGLHDPTYHFLDQGRRGPRGWGLESRGPARAPGPWGSGTAPRRPGCSATKAARTRRCDRGPGTGCCPPAASSAASRRRPRRTAATRARPGPRVGGSAKWRRRGPRGRRARRGRGGCRAAAARGSRGTTSRGRRSGRWGCTAGSGRRRTRRGTGRAAPWHGRRTSGAPADGGARAAPLGVPLRPPVAVPCGPCAGVAIIKKKLGVSNTPYDGGRWVTDGGWWVTDGG